MEKFEWIVTLHNRDDLNDFYDDMETPGGSITIPDRKVELVNRRLISRNTHYMLTHDEAAEVLADPRVWGVDLADEVIDAIKPSGYTVNEKFSKDWNSDASDVNWGLLRHSEATNRNNWGSNALTNITSDLTVTASGKNVDVLIVDGHIDPAHPEFAVNSDGTGGSRINQFNWFSLTSDIGLGSNGTYNYGTYVVAGDADETDDNDHGCHVGGTVAGNKQGWARDANIFNISPYGSNNNSGASTYLWDYIRQWHNTKPINSETGRRNPTISNHSYGSGYRINYGSWGPIISANYRGVNFNPGRDLTAAELQARGFYAPSNVDVGIPAYFTSRQADMEDAADDGVIIVVAAGNDYWKIVNAADQDYNNTYQSVNGGITRTLYTNRGTGAGAGYAPNIVVGAGSNDLNEDKAGFSNVGSQVDVFAAGEGIQSSLHTGSTNDPRNSTYKIGKYQGTSMASPQVCGVLALLAESWPGMDQAQAQQWISDNAGTDVMADTGADDAMDTNSLQGAPNKYLRWINQRPTDGFAFPKRTFSNRPTTGNTYPRSRVRRKG